MLKFIKLFSSKIANKLFLVTLIIIITIFLLQLIAYTFIFDDIYYMKKDSELKNDFMKFSNEIKASNYNQTAIKISTENYVATTGNPVLIIGPDELLYNEALIPICNHILTVEKDNINYKFILSASDLDKVNFDFVNILAYKISDNYYYPIHLTASSLDDSADAEIVFTDDSIIFENAQITDLHILSEGNLNIGLELFSALQYIDQDYEINTENAFQNFKYPHSNGNDYTIVYISHFYFGNDLYYIMTSEAYNNSKEEFGFMNYFNQIIFLLTVIVSIVITRIFSKSITKPIVELSSIAQQMSSFDFSKKAILHSNNEITELANSLNQMSLHLEKKFEELDKANQELQFSYELKSKEEEATKDLILHLSHELNTPLSIVSGYSEVLLDGINDKSPEYYYEAITNEIDRMKFLVSDMLELSTILQDGYVLEKTPVNVKEIVEERIDKYKQNFENKHVRVQVVLESEFVEANYRKIHQVINNFILNANKYSDDGGEFKIYDKKTDNEIYYYFENSADFVEDNLELYWKKFYRTSKHNRINERGSGVGLAISKEILELHNSTYGIDKTDNGIRFYFSLFKS